jgi:RNA polymerase sigma factor (sigma-70 family)
MRRFAALRARQAGGISTMGKLRRKGANPPRFSSLITDIHPKSSPVEPFNAACSPSLSGDTHHCAPTGAVHDNSSDAIIRYEKLINTILTEDYGISSDIEDVKNDVVVEICKGWVRKQESDERATKAWIRSTVHHVVMKHRHQVKRGARTGCGPELFESIPASGDREPTLAELIDRETRERIAVALNELPEPLRQAVELRSGTEKTIPEIADELGCSPRKVNFLLARARASLRRELMPLTEEDATDSHGRASPAARWRHWAAHRKCRSS